MVPTVLCCCSERAMRSIEGSSAWSPECTTEAICFEHPKSASFTSPSWSTRTFDPFMSRWTMPFVCRYSSPASICLEYLSIIRTKKPHRSRENMQAFVRTEDARRVDPSPLQAQSDCTHAARTAARLPPDHKLGQRAEPLEHALHRAARHVLQEYVQSRAFGLHAEVPAVRTDAAQMAVVRARKLAHRTMFG